MWALHVFGAITEDDGGVRYGLDKGVKVRLVNIKECSSNPHWCPSGYRCKRDYL